MKGVKGLGLFSGGLDSILAARMLQEQGIAVTGIVFISAFFGSQHARASAGEISLPLIEKDFTEQHLALVKHPPHGYGSNMNPCIDCHALMFQEAGRIMETEWYDFLFTGEVLNERPMSQTRYSLAQVAKLSGYKDRILRPLSAKLLPETEPEREGLVQRERLLDIQGRSRKRQLSLAEHYGIKQYPAPAGGCLLTDPNFSKRLKELFTRHPDCAARDVELLKVGRHFRIGGVKVVVGRNARENDRIRSLATVNDIVLSAEHLPGPIALISGGSSPQIIAQAAGLCVRYSDVRNEKTLPAVDQIYPSFKKLIPQLMSDGIIEALKI